MLLRQGSDDAGSNKRMPPSVEEIFVCLHVGSIQGFPKRPKNVADQPTLPFGIAVRTMFMNDAGSMENVMSISILLSFMCHIRHARSCLDPFRRRETAQESRNETGRPHGSTQPADRFVSAPPTGVDDPADDVFRDMTPRHDVMDQDCNVHVAPNDDDADDQGMHDPVTCLLPCP